MMATASVAATGTPQTPGALLSLLSGWRWSLACPVATNKAAMIPGEIITDDSDHSINPGRRSLTLVVRNTADRPIQVGSHYHFAETNGALGFDRTAAHGMRLNIPSGSAVRFEPGQQRTVELVDYAGDRRVFGFRGLVQGQL